MLYVVPVLPDSFLSHTCVTPHPLLSRVNHSTSPMVFTFGVIITKKLKVNYFNVRLIEKGTVKVSQSYMLYRIFSRIGFLKETDATSLF